MLRSSVLFVCLVGVRIQFLCAEVDNKLIEFTDRLIVIIVFHKYKSFNKYSSVSCIYLIVIAWL